MKPCYEAHITYAKEHREAVQQVGDNPEFAWTFSEITGCPILGQGTYCYLTGYDPDPNVLRRRMQAVAATLATVSNAEPLRMKIEHIVYDTKTGRDDLA